MQRDVLAHPITLPLFIVRKKIFFFVTSLDNLLLKDEWRRYMFTSYCQMCKILYFCALLIIFRKYLIVLYYFTFTPPPLPPFSNPFIFLFPLADIPFNPYPHPPPFSEICIVLKSFMSWGAVTWREKKIPANSRFKVR